MKQYTSNDQTAKLIELGFEKPNGIESLVREEDNPDNAKVVQRIAYSIGELIEMLPSVLDDHKQLCIESSGGKWWVAYINLWDKKYFVRKDELIDALYDVIVKLKAEGVI